jgi:hypothetical protein
MTSSKMISSKINTFIDNKKLCNILKIIFLLILLLIIYMYFTNNITNKYDKYYENKNNNYNIYENFTSSQDYIFYGNVISLKNQLNRPAYSGNQCIFELDDVYRIDTLQFNFNPKNINNIKYTGDQSIYIQFIDADGNTRYIKSGNRADSPPSIHSPAQPTINGDGSNDNEYYLFIQNIKDENNLPVYTSKIIILIDSSIAGSETISLDKYTDPLGYVSRFGIFGGPRTLLTKKDYDTIKRKLIKSTSSNVRSVVDTQHQISTLTFTNVNVVTNGDMKIYSIMLLISQAPEPIAATPAPSCFNINIQYINSIYLSNNFSIKTTYKVRSDINQLVPNNANYPAPPSVFIFFDEPIIASTLIFNINNILNYTLAITSITVNGVIPTADDIIDFKRNANFLLNSENDSDNSNVCPNVNDLLEKQTKTQAICDNLEYQDKVKSEKMRLERNKQYLLKLKNQQEKIDQLNEVIQELETKRAARAATADQAKLLQYQNQKGSVSTIRDLANQRLESQDKNKLYMDLKLNYT